MAKTCFRGYIKRACQQKRCPSFPFDRISKNTYVEDPRSYSRTEIIISCENRFFFFFFHYKNYLHPNLYYEVFLVLIFIHCLQVNTFKLKEP